MAKQRNPKGMGSFRQLQNGTYQWRQRIDGEERTFTAATPKELQEKIKKIADLPIIKNKLKVSEWFEKWLEVYIKPLKKKATYNQYKILYEQHIKPEIGNRKINGIKQYDIQKIISVMNTKVIQEAEYDKDGYETKPEKIGLSTWTMKHTRKVMNIALTKALDDKIIAENPVYKIEIPKKQAKPQKTLKTSELKTLFEYAKKTRWYWAMRFLLVTGLRRGELLALRWSDIDYDNKRVIVDESNSTSGIGDVKSAKEHYAPLSDLAVYYLGKQKEMLINEPNPILHNERLKVLNLIFPSEDGTMMRPDSFNSAIDRINVKAGIHVTPHMFRHTFVFMSKGLLSRSELQEALGHDESTTTEDIYGTMLSDTHKVSNKIDEAFKDLDIEIDKIEEKKQGKVIQFRKTK
jgi:integrase